MITAIWKQTFMFLILQFHFLHFSLIHQVILPFDLCWWLVDGFGLVLFGRRVILQRGRKGLRFIEVVFWFVRVVDQFAHNFVC